MDRHSKPVVSMSLENVTNFRQQNQTLRHSDVFSKHILQDLWNERQGWDNLSGTQGEEIEVETLAECRERCQAQQDCMQYRLAAGKCTISNGIKFGEPVSTESKIQSGWMTERIGQAVLEAEPCYIDEWIV